MAGTRTPTTAAAAREHRRARPRAGTRVLRGQRLRGLLAVLGLLGAALGLLSGAPTREARAAPPPGKAPPPGLRWEGTAREALARARREGRPLLVCVNALEDERANIRLATELYRDPAWGRATRAYVCVVANPNDHGAGATCERYGHVACSAHKDVLAWVLRAVSRDGALISPQHLIVEPDGAIAYRKEYFEGHEGPALFEAWLAVLAPAAALRQARADRSADLEQLASCPPKDTAAFARAIVKRAGDGLAGLVLVAALEDASDAVRRTGLLDALGDTPPAQGLALVPAAEAATAEPALAPGDALAWTQALLRVDRALGLWAAARVIARGDAAQRTRVLEAVAGDRAPAALARLPAGERALLEEALRLAGASVPAGLAPGDEEGLEAVPRTRRERARAHGQTPRPQPLPAALAGLAPGEQRRALLAAGAESVQSRAAEVRTLLERSPHLRVRIAAALALLGAGLGPAEAVAGCLEAAFDDPLEGPETREMARARLPEDPGENPDEWARLLRARAGGGK
ncbi:MAG: hypothetical protein ACKOSS_01205 [Planctomycetia bacterium]